MLESCFFLFFFNSIFVASKDSKTEPIIKADSLLQYKKKRYDQSEFFNEKKCREKYEKESVSRVS